MQVTHLLEENKPCESSVKYFEIKIKNLNFQMNHIKSRYFTLDRFTSDYNTFYTGLTYLATLDATCNYLDPWKNGETIRFCYSSNDKDVLNSHYDSVTDSESEVEETQSKVRGDSKPALTPREELFIVLCRLKQGFSEKHLGHL